MKLLILVGLIGIFSGCASPTIFPYRFYYLDLNKKVLLGNEEKNDLSLEACSSAEFNHNCVVVLKPEFINLYRGYLEK